MSAPMTSKQAFSLLTDFVNKSSCGIVWKNMHAQGMTMAGPPWKVTLTVGSSKKGKGAAIWMIDASGAKPANTLAKKLAAGCK